MRAAATGGPDVPPGPTSAVTVTMGGARAKAHRVLGSIGSAGDAYDTQFRMRALSLSGLL